VPAPRDLPRTIGFLPAAGVMIGVTVGSGIYSTPASIAQHLSSSWQVIAAWVVGGLLSFFGALTYAELAVMFPRSGGLYNFLYQGLGPRVSFIFGWTYMLITKPLAAAGICVIFADYLTALGGADLYPWLMQRVPGAPGLEAVFGDSWHKTLLVCGTLGVLTYINYLGMRLGSFVNLALTVIKIGCLLAIVALAFALGGAPASPSVAAETSAASAPVGPNPLLLAALAPVLAAVLWTYDGWSDIGSIAGEVRDPTRNLPRIFLLGTLGLIVLYVLVNLAYLRVLPLEEMRGSKAVASDVMTRLIGPNGSAVVTAFVLLSTLGATHAAILTGARVTFAQAQDGLLFRFLGRIHPRHETPGVSLWVQFTMSCLCMIFLRQFESLAGGFVFTMWIFYGLGGIALFRLRKLLPDVPRPYRCWGYPVVPLLFIAAAAGMTVLQLWDSFTATVKEGEIPPYLRTCGYLAVLGAGWPAYALWKRATRV